VRVVMVTNSIAPDALGGLDRYARELSAALVREGLEVSVVTKRGRPELPSTEVGDDGVRITRFDLPPKTNPLYAPRYALAPWLAVREALRAAPDAIVHGHFPVQTLPVTFMRRPFLFSFQSPVYKEVLEEREFPLAAALHRATVEIVKGTERRVVSTAARNVVLSRFMQGELATLSARAAEEALVLPGAVDLEHFTPGEGIDDRWAREASPLLFTARRFVPRTGVAQLVRAMPAILEHHPGARLAVAGAGPLEADIRADIVRLGLDERVALLGRIPEAELVRWYRSATLVVMPTQELEGFGLTTAEAMACGTPVVGTPAGSVPEVVGRLDARLVTRSASSADIAAKVVEVAGENGYLTGLRARAREAVDPVLGWRHTAQAFIREYEAAQRRAAS
jgi:glycosyltransferase involved in cell wall biosynthesis